MAPCSRNRCIHITTGKNKPQIPLFRLEMTFCRELDFHCLYCLSSPPFPLEDTIQAMGDPNIFYAVLLDIFVSLKSEQCQMEAPCSLWMIISSILLRGCITYVHVKLEMLFPCMSCECSRARRRLRKSLS